MKPSEHVEFYTRAPPPGQSRESGIRLDRHGDFWHHGQRIAHRGMARAFASWIARHPHDGRYILDNGYDWAYLEVEDAPQFAVGLAWNQGDGDPSDGDPSDGGAVLDRDGAPPSRPTNLPSGIPDLVLASGRRVRLNPTWLHAGLDGVLRYQEPAPALPIGFTRDAQLGLGEFLVARDDGGLALRFGSRAFPLSGP